MGEVKRTNPRQVLKSAGKTMRTAPGELAGAAKGSAGKAKISGDTKERAASAGQAQLGHAMRPVVLPMFGL